MELPYPISDFPMPRLIVHGFTLSLAPRTFRPALPAVLTTLAMLVCCTLAHA